MFSRAILALFRSSIDIPSTVRPRAPCPSETPLCFRTICAFASPCDSSPSPSSSSSSSAASSCRIVGVDGARSSSKSKESASPTPVVRRRARIKDDLIALASSSSSSSSSQKERKDFEPNGGDEGNGDEHRRRRSKAPEVRDHHPLEMLENAADFQNVWASEGLVAERDLSGTAALLCKGHESADPSVLAGKKARTKSIRISRMPSWQESEEGMDPRGEANAADRINEREFSIDGALCTECTSDEEAQYYADVGEASRASSVGRDEGAAVDSCGFSVASSDSESIVVPERLILKVALLEESGVDPSDLAILLKKRALVSVSLEKLKSAMELLVGFFGEGEAACKVLAQNSGILSKPLEKLEFKLRCLEEFELGRDTCQRIGAAKHAILTMAGEALHEKLCYLRSIGLSPSSINVLLSRFPQVLRLTVAASIEPTLVYLESKGMDREEINALILKHPSLLAMSVGNNLDKKFELLGSLGLSNEECRKAIGFLTLPSCDRARSVLETLKSYGISEPDISEMVRKNPDIFSRSPENISKKIEWLINEGDREIEEIIHYPTCLCFHLDNRIVPRINALKETKFRVCPLSTVLSMPDESFRAQFHLPDFPSSKKSRQPRRQ